MIAKGFDPNEPRDADGKWTTGGNSSVYSIPPAPVTKTPAFKNWFGDWENDPKNASKVTEWSSASMRKINGADSPDNAKPLVVHHGTRNPGFDEFQVSQSESGKGIFFTDSAFSAEEYARGEMDLDENPAGKLHDSAGIYSAYLNIRNPAIHDIGGKSWVDIPMASMIEKARKDGHDGVILQNIRDGKFNKLSVNTVYVAFDPKQVKSATGNQGTFDPTSPKIHKAFELEQQTRLQLIYLTARLRRFA